MINKNFARLKEKIKNREAVVCVLGLGYVGLPLALAFAKKGFTVIGLDTDGQKVKSLRAGRSHVEDIPDSLLRGKGGNNFRASGDFREIKKADVIHICVPTPLRKTKDPDISFILQAARQIKEHLQEGYLIVLQSTTYPGTTEEMILPLLEKGGYKAGRDFFLAFSPERVDPGNKKFGIENTPKVVGGVTPGCLRLGIMLFREICGQVISVSSPRAAEMVKLLENTYRMVNVALVNEIALICRKMGIDTWEVIKGASSKPFGFMPFYPGPGLGGHCLPIDPVYLSWKARLFDFEARFIDLATRINAHMPVHVVERVTEILNSAGKAVKGSRIFIIGVTYKKDVSDIRESPAVEIMSRLHDKRARLFYHDPWVSEMRIKEERLSCSPLRKDLLRGADLICILTDHSSLDYARIFKEGKKIFDTRGISAFLGNGNAKVVRL